MADNRKSTSILVTRRKLLAAGAAGVGILAMPGIIGRARAQEKLKVAAIYTVPVEQQWVSRIHKAANAAVERGDIEYVFSEKVANTDYERVMREYSEAGNKLIVGEVFGVEDAARSVAKDYPETSYLMGSSLMANDDWPNFAVFDNYIQDASYLTGIIAGAMTKSKNIGMVGGFPIPEVNRLMNAFMAGVRETAPDTKFQVAFIGSWFDPPKAKETAFAQIDAGADVCMPSASACPMPPRSARSWPSATSSTPSRIIPRRSSPLRCGISSRRSTMPSPRSRTACFKAENYGIYSFMKEGGCSLAPLGTFEGKVPAEAMAKVAEREAAIKAGTFTVKINDAEPKSS